MLLLRLRREAIASAIQLEAPDPYADRELCGGRSTVGYRDGDKVLVVMNRVASVRCPGTPVRGRLELKNKLLNGELDGHAYRDAGTNQGVWLGAGWTNPTAVSPWICPTTQSSTSPPTTTSPSWASVEPSRAVA
jgi:hypothetical protein